MARKIKSPLDMGNETMVRTIEELKDNYNSEKVVSYFLDGQLLTWLKDRYYDDEASKVESLVTDNDPIALASKLAGIFGIKAGDEIDVKSIAERNEKLNKLRKFTSDDDILNNIDHVAFSQEELSDILDEGAEVIYLCGDSFRIPLSEKGKKYVGINDPVIEIKTSVSVNLDTYDIFISKCHLSEKTSAMVFSSQQLIEKGLQYLSADDFSNALKCFKQAADSGSHEGLFQYAKMYANGTGVKQDTKLAKDLYLKAAEKGSAKACNNLGTMCEEDEEYDEAFEWFEKGVALGGSSWALYNLGHAYINPNYGKNDPARAEYYLNSAYEGGIARAAISLAKLYANQKNAEIYAPEKALNLLDKMEESADKMYDYKPIVEIYLNNPSIFNRSKVLELIEKMEQKAKNTYDFLQLVELYQNTSISLPDKAYSLLLKAKKLNEQDKEPLYCTEIGDALYNLGKIDEALIEYRKDAESKTPVWGAVEALVNHYKRIGDDKQVLKWSMYFLENIAEIDDFLLNVGQYYFDHFNADGSKESLETFKKANYYLSKAADEWNNVEAIELLARLLLYVHLFEESAEYYKRCIDERKSRGLNISHTLENEYKTAKKAASGK